MIRYPVSKKRLDELLEQEKPGWLKRARKRTNKFKILGRYQEPSSIWSEVKAVYLKLQHGKCAYCEKKLESEEFGLIEHDLEHFRPRKMTKHWPLPRSLEHAGINITQPIDGETDPGYHLLAYHPLNFCTSCKTCNSIFKGNYFPIEGKRKPAGDDPVRLCDEKPLLLNPVGDFDDDPEELIHFCGLSPVSTGNSDYQRHRGLVIIAFFHLDDFNRKNLLRERAEIIVSLYSFLRHAESADSPEAKKIYEDLVEIYKRPSAPHANCARSYHDLFREQREAANDIFNGVRKFLGSISP